MRVIFLFLAWAVLTTFGLSRLSFNVDVLDLLPADQPEFDGIRDLYRHFGRKNELIITLSAADAVSTSEAASSLADHLSARTDLARSVVGELPFEERPEEAAGLLAWLWLNGPPEAIVQLTMSLEGEQLPNTLDAVLEELTSGFVGEATLLRSYDPLGLTDLPGGLRESVGADADLFASADGTFRVLYVEAPVDSFASYREVAAWIDSLQTALGEWRSDHPDPVAIGLTGEPAFVAEISLAMERDLTGSVIATTLLIAGLFWLWHRRIVPLLWLMLMLGLVFSATFALGGAFFGTLTAMSIGFAAILLGLAVDYGIILYRESRAGGGDPAQLRRVIGPSIFWAAATTAAVFASLNFSSLPGIADLGTLVAIGTLVGAGVMLGIFAPIVAKSPIAESIRPPHRSEGSGKAPLLFTVASAVAGLITWAVAGPPGLNRDARPFQLRDSPATSAFEEMAQRLGSEEKGGLPHLPVIITADTPVELADRLGEAETRLQTARENGRIREFQLPRSLAPDGRNQQANREPLARLAADHQRLTAAILEAGFSEEATVLTRRVLEAWTALGSGASALTQPQSGAGRWLLGRAISLPAPGETGACAAVGRLLPGSLETDAEGHLDWAGEVNAPGIQITGWEILNPALQSLVAGDFRRVFIPMAAILALMLWLVFRNLGETLLAIGSLAFSGLALMTLARWLPVEWNTFNASSLPILFGTGLDYGIHMIFALRRENGDMSRIRAGIQKALLFCGLSTAAGFGSLAFSSSEGLSSLGTVCALGILVNMATAVWLLPSWWQRWKSSRGIRK